MSVYIGGSAYYMAQSIAEGYIITTELIFKKFQDSELQTFIVESERLLREIRGSVPAADDPQGVQNRLRRIQRVVQAIAIANNVRQRRR